MQTPVPRQHLVAKEPGGEIKLNVKGYGNSDGVISILPQRRPVAMMGEGEGVKGPVVALLEKRKIKINFQDVLLKNTRLF